MQKRKKKKYRVFKKISPNQQTKKKLRYSPIFNFFCDVGKHSYKDNSSQVFRSFIVYGGQTVFLLL